MTQTAENRELLSRISWAYYMAGMTQAEVAKWLGITRIRVNRLLQICRDEGYVHIHINTQRSGCYTLENALEKKYGLQKALVVPSLPTSQALNRFLGHAAANYLCTILEHGHSLGLGWGTTVFHAANAARKCADNLTIVSLYGGLPHSIVISPYEIVATFSRKLQAKQTFYIAAPMFAPSPEASQMLKSQQLFKSVYSQAVRVDTALIGLGELSAQATNSALGAITDTDLHSLRDAGAVGEIFGNFVNSAGIPVDHSVNQCFMGPAMHEAKAIPVVIAAAGGSEKRQIIQAALRGEFLHVLITDEAVAKWLLDHA